MIEDDDGDQTDEREPETLTELAWQELDSLARNARKEQSLPGNQALLKDEKIDPQFEPARRQIRLLDRMIEAIERRDIPALRRLADEEDVFAYTGNLRRLLKMLDEDQQNPPT